jgi:hypothetical protein
VNCIRALREPSRTETGNSPRPRPWKRNPAKDKQSHSEPGKSLPVLPHRAMVLEKDNDPQMSRPRIARPRGRPLKGSARDRARQCFAWFTFVREQIQAAVVGRNGSLMRVSSTCAMVTLVQSASDVCARLTFGSKFREGLEVLGYRDISANNLSRFDRNFIRALYLVSKRHAFD